MEEILLPLFQGGRQSMEFMKPDLIRQFVIDQIASLDLDNPAQDR